MNKINLLLVVGGIVAAGLMVVGAQPPSSSDANQNVAYAQATVYKSPTCDCCTEYIAYLEANGVDVTVESTDDMSAIKTENNIPEDMASCHTTMMGDYFIEGHVPFEVMKQMMEDMPAIDGIALPGMPDGSSGMPGEKTEPFQIHQLMQGEDSPYMMM